MITMFSDGPEQVESWHHWSAVFTDFGSVEGEPGQRQAATPLADELQDVLTLCAVIGLEGRQTQTPTNQTREQSSGAVARQRPSEIQVLTFVAMRNLFQSSLLASAEDRSTLFLRTG